MCILVVITNRPSLFSHAKHLGSKSNYRFVTSFVHLESNHNEKKFMYFVIVLTNIQNCVVCQTISVG